MDAGSPGFDVAEIRRAGIEELIVRGGDSRSVVNPLTGLNKYGCSPTPRQDAVPLGSCTSSSVSPSGFAAASTVLRRLIAVDPKDGLEDTVEEAFEHTRNELRFLATGGYITGVDVVLTPSGTDAEFVAVLVALAGDERELTNIVVGPSEVGSGTAPAAGMLHFDEMTPSGLSRTAGEPLDEQVVERVSVKSVAVRTGDGVPRSERDIDDEVRALVDQEIARGRKVLVHIVAHSKTGVHAPTLGTVGALADRHGRSLCVVVDAAQGRFSRRGLNEVLRRGCMALLTGSKFYGGPPFAGALLVPEELDPVARGARDWPAALGAYLTRAQLPRRWAALREGLPPPGNPGLLLRWEAALAEMRDYYATPSRLRLRVLREFERVVPQIIGDSDHVRLDAISPPVLADEAERLLESKTTVFPFSVWQTGNEPRRLVKSELGAIYRCLNVDGSRLLTNIPPEARRALAPRFHIGQPVAVGDDAARGPAVLRIALGGVLLSDLAQNLSRGETIEDRFDWLEDQLIALKRKVETLATHIDSLDAATPASQAAATA